MSTDADYELPTEVGESVEIPAPTDSDGDTRDHHKAILKDPPGSLTRKFHCERCGHWYTSTRNFELNPCIPREEREVGQ